MYAVIESGGKQYRVAVGDRVRVESLKAEPGTQVQLRNVLLVADGDQVEIGSPYTGAVVSATVVEQGRAEKVRILKFRRRQNSRRHAGHRQNYTELEITGIGESSGAVSEATVETAGQDAGGEEAGKTGAQASAGHAADTAGAQSDDRGGDLTRLAGVGPVLAEKLRDAGVTSLAQIAAWTDDDIARIDEALGIRARVERDDWVAQARKLTEETD